MKKFFAIITLVFVCSFAATTSYVIAQENGASTEVVSPEAPETGNDEVTGTDETTGTGESSGEEMISGEETQDEALSEETEESETSFLDTINYKLGNAIGLTLFDPQHFISLVMRFIINLIVVTIIARCFYYPRSRRRDYMFIFILMASSIFLLVSLMEGDGMNLGAAMGLFAIFGIMRFRTEAVPIREMTYLFMLIAVSVVNALSRAEYHPKADYWDGFGIVTIVFVNLVFLGMAWLFESSRLVSSNCSKYILYDNISLITPEKRDELKADLEKRTGLKIERLEVGTVDFLKDSCMIRIFYDYPFDRGNSIEGMVKMPRT